MPATALDTDLVANVKKALKRDSARPMFFALVMKGGTDGKLIVSKSKIAPKQIDGAKKETGGSAVLKGVCFGEDGTLVFETGKPAAPNVAGVTRNVLKAKAGLVLKVEYRVGRDDEAVAESAEPELPSDEAGKAVPGAEGVAAAAADPAAEWKAKLAEWAPAIKAALTAKGPHADDIGKLLAQANALAKPGGDMAQALARLAECHALATGGAAPAAAPKAAAADPAAEWKAKLAAWAPAIKAALAAKGPHAGDIGKLLAQATALAKPGGDMAQALARLTECHALATAPNQAEANWAKAFAAIEPAYLQGLRDRPDAANTLRAVMGFARGKAEKKDFAGAIAALQKLVEALRTKPTPGKGTAPAPGGGEAVQGDVARVEFAKIKLEWNQAKQAVQSQLDQLAADIRADDDIAVPEFDEDGNVIGVEPDDTKGSEKKLAKVLAGFNANLADTLDAHYNAEPAARPAILKTVATIANKYLAYVDGDELIAHVEANPYRKVAIRGTLRPPLAKLLEQIAAASKRA